MREAAQGRPCTTSPSELLRLHAGPCCFSHASPTHTAQPLSCSFVLISESDLPLWDGAQMERRWTDELKVRSQMARRRIQCKAWMRPWFYGSWEMPCVAAGQLGLADASPAGTACLPCPCPYTPSTFPDEHYFPTLLAVLGKENETFCDTSGVSGQVREHACAVAACSPPVTSHPALVGRARTLRDPQGPHTASVI